MENDEIFVDIQGFEGQYLVSNLGRIKAIRGRGRVRGNGPLFSCGYIDSVGYRSVIFRKDGKRAYFRVHRLVALHFLPPPLTPEKTHVNHIDGNPLNNHVLNLEWVSHKGNSEHAVKHGLLDRKGQKHENAKLTDDQVVEIRQMYLDHTQQQIADKYGIGRRHIGDILSGTYWPHLPLVDYSNRKYIINWKEKESRKSTYIDRRRPN